MGKPVSETWILMKQEMLGC